MRFTGEHDLHRPPGLIENLLQAVDVAQHQGSALIGGKAACKADGQGVWVKHFIGGIDFRLGRSATLKLYAQAAPGERHQPLSPTLVASP